MPKNLETVGIDLGTTNSLIVRRGGSGQLQVITNDEGERMTPSVVMFSPDRVVVGTSALRAAVGENERVCREIKRHMGEDFSFQTPEGEEYTPAEVSAQILKKLKNSVEEKFNREVKKAVISVPARFGTEAKEATETAGEIAGFEEISLIHEPTAAVLSEYYYSKGLPEKIMVYDLGGGTFDLSILNAKPPDFDILSIDGDEKLGGIDFTSKIVNYIEKKTKGLPNKDFKQEVRKSAEDLKRDLSIQKESSVGIHTPEGLKSFHLTREKYESMIKPLVEKTIEISERALTQADLTKEEIDKIIMVGGSTRTPLVQKEVEQYFNQEPQKSVQPDEAVAIGARFKGSTENNQDSYSDDGHILPNPYVNVILAKSVGVEAVDADTDELVNQIMINKNSELPASNTLIFSTENDGQTAVKITLYEGESRHPKNCSVIGQKEGFILEGIPAKKAGVPRIQVTLKVDKNGIINLKAHETESGQEINVQCKRPEIVDKSEKEKAKKRLNEKVLS